MLWVGHKLQGNFDSVPFRVMGLGPLEPQFPHHAVRLIRTPISVRQSR